MSLANIDKFKNAATSDPKTFQAEFEKEKANLKGNFASEKDRSYQALINMGNRRGFQFTKEELGQAAANTELSDADLELIAGGTT